MENNEMVVSQVNSMAIVDNLDSNLIRDTLSKIASFQTVIQTALKPGKDYGRIPGAGDKPSLFKPGAEKVNMLFGVNPEYEFLKADEDFKNGFFNYNIKCTLYRNGQPVSQGVGNCNSMEKKYRYITVDEKGLDEYGAAKETAVKFTDKFGRIKYRIPNPEPASLTNTILKMAKKRAYVDATLQVASLSDLFTQDIEDMDIAFEQEATATMTAENAENIVINFGKYKGTKIKDLLASDRGYLEWLADNAKESVIKKAAAEVLNPSKSAPKKHAKKAAESEEAPIPSDEDAPDNNSRAEWEVTDDELPF